MYAVQAGIFSRDGRRYLHTSIYVNLLFSSGSSSCVGTIPTWKLLCHFHLDAGTTLFVGFVSANLSPHT